MLVIDDCALLVTFRAMLLDRLRAGLDLLALLFSLDKVEPAEVLRGVTSTPVC